MRPMPYLIILAALMVGRLIFDLLRNERGAMPVDGRVSFDLVIIAIFVAFFLVARGSASQLVASMRRRNPDVGPVLIRATRSLNAVLGKLGFGKRGPSQSNLVFRVGMMVVDGNLEFWTKSAGAHTLVPHHLVSGVVFVNRSATLRQFSAIEVHLTTGERIEIIIMDSVLRLLPLNREQNRRVVTALQTSLQVESSAEIKDAGGLR